MHSLAHRGLWAARDDGNSLPAFHAAFKHGWGAELDVRDQGGVLVVSHEPPPPDALLFDDVVAAYLSAGCPGALAVNVKADGLAELLAEAMRGVPPERWFAFDMSVPDTLAFARAGVPFFTRHSDVEPTPPLYAEAAGVWLDDFHGGFIAEAHIAAHLDAGKRVAVVSPELHRRDRVLGWSEWRAWEVWGSGEVMLCTDHPDLVRGVFG